jgi:hypothetical protein
MIGMTCMSERLACSAAFSNLGLAVAADSFWWAATVSLPVAVHEVTLHDSA